MKIAEAELVYKWYCPYISCKSMEANENYSFQEDKKGREIGICSHCGREIRMI